MKQKFIAIFEEDYVTLKRLGNKGDSFAEIFHEVMKRANLQRGQKLLEATT
jgi:predicted CopG family antitoxin